MAGRKKALVLQPWGGAEGARMVAECCEEQGLACEMIQNLPPFSWNNPLAKLIYWYGPSLKVAIQGLRRRQGKDVILAYDPMCGLMFTALARIMRLSHPPVVVSMFLLCPWRYAIVDKLRYAFTNFALARVDRIICFSSYEVERYQREFPKHAQKLAFVPVGADPAILDVEAETARVKAKPPAPYVFSGGTANRDYPTLMRAISTMPEVPLKIIAKKKDFPGDAPNLEFLENVYGAAFERAIFDAAVVVVPLYDQCFASGQLTMLKSMELGKAIVASDVPGVKDYITDGEDGLLVPAGDAGKMAEAIRKLLDDGELRQRLGRQARINHQQKFTQKMSVSQIISFAAELAGASRA